MHPQYTPEFIEWFWSQVDKTSSPLGCWLWTGPLTHNGYGDARHRGVRVRTNRCAFELAGDEIPSGALVCHDCDRFYPSADITYRRCVRRSHLFAGTALDNSRDAVAKGRLTGPHNPLRGPSSPHAKLAVADVREIRRLYAMKLHYQREIAEMYGITQGCVKQIVNRLTWKNVD